MSRARPLLLACLVASVAALPTPHVTSAQPAAKPRKVAFLVGVGEFRHDLDDLKGSPQKDVTALADVLRAGGFEVVVLKDAEATKAAVEKRFAALLEGDGVAANVIGKKDLLLVAVCTHGFTLPPAEGKPDTPFLAAHDSKLDLPGTMVSLNGLIDAAKSSGATALYLIDACREMTDVNRGQKRGVEGAGVSLPAKTAILFSCRRGQVAHQNPKADGHGLFTWAVLNALRTEGVPKDDVSWTELVAGVQKSFRSPEFRAMIPAGQPQVPVLAVGGEFDDAHLMTVKPSDDPKAGEVRKFEVAPGVFMEFCWIPPGKATLGSPKEEKERDNTDEDDRAYESKGFWLGKYEVTQDEWVKVMKVANPSYFAATGSVGAYRDRVKGMDTSKFPVETVSWEDICGKDGKSGAETFLGKVNARPGAKTAFGKSGKFVLPTENEWEYAARGGHKDRRPFYWGSGLDGSQANCDGSNPYQAQKTTNFLERTCAVNDVTLRTTGQNRIG